MSKEFTLSFSKRCVYVFFSVSIVLSITISIFLPIDLLQAAQSSPSGSYNHGQLKNGLSLFQIFKRKNGLFESLSPEGFQYGTKSMVGALEKIARWSLDLSKHPLRVGDIATRRGGKIALHVTHQNGLDVDLAYLSKKPASTGHRFKKFHNRFRETFDSNGQIHKNFDVEMNYRLFRRMSENLPLKTIMVSCGIMKELLAFDATQSSSIKKFFYGHDLHTDHFHLRLKCPKSASGCSEKWWRDPSPKAKKKKSRDYSCATLYPDSFSKT